MVAIPVALRQQINLRPEPRGFPAHFPPPRAKVALVGLVNRLLSTFESPERDHGGDSLPGSACPQAPHFRNAHLRSHGAGVSTAKEKKSYS